MAKMKMEVKVQDLERKAAKMEKELVEVKVQRDAALRDTKLPRFTVATSRPHLFTVVSPCAWGFCAPSARILKPRKGKRRYKSKAAMPSIAYRVAAGSFHLTVDDFVIPCRHIDGRG
eukprot:GHVS01074576.1.p1 GENE.GHVS01074576.1~~GHVS01074576.1.p1  ORF type:complete len:117 (-),score=6.19 GHVS01074576.1:79-429(-)